MEMLLYLLRLLFAKSKNKYFQHFSDVLFELSLKPPYRTLSMKVRCVIFFMRWTIIHTHSSFSNLKAKEGNTPTRATSIRQN